MRNSRLALIVSVLMLAHSAVAQPAENSPLQLVQTIPLTGVEGRIDHLSIDPEGQRLFIAALGNNTVEIVDLQTGRQSGRIKDISEPQGVCFIRGDPARLAVASGGDGKCRFYDAASLKLLATLDDLPDADNVRCDPVAGRIYVGYGDGALAIIDAGKMNKLDEIKLQGHPESFQLEAKGPRIFVNIPTAQHVAVIDREKLRIIDRFAVSGARANFPMALDEANQRLFVACRAPARMMVFDTSTGRRVATGECAADADDVFYDPPAKRIYISGGDGSISVIEQIDPDHYNPLASIPTAPGARTSLLDAEHKKLYLAVPHRGGQPAEVRVYQAP